MNTIQKSIKTKLLTAFLFVLFSTASIQAQGFDEDVDDEVAAAPIDGFILAGLVAGSVFGIRKIRKSSEEA